MSIVWPGSERATGNIAGFLGVAGSCCRLFRLLPARFWRVPRIGPGNVAGSPGNVWARCRVVIAHFSATELRWAGLEVRCLLVAQSSCYTVQRKPMA